MKLTHYSMLLFLMINVSQSAVIRDGMYNAHMMCHYMSFHLNFTLSVSNLYTYCSLVVPDAYWVFKSNKYESNLPYLQDQKCISVQNIGHFIDNDMNTSKRDSSVLLRCAQPSALFDGEIGRDIPLLPEASDLLKHYTWKKAITPNPFVAMEFISPLTELTSITLFFYNDGNFNIHLPHVSLCVSTSRDIKQCSKVALLLRPSSRIGVVAWPVTLTPVKSVTFLNISFQYVHESIHQWIFLSEVRVSDRKPIQGEALMLLCS